VSQEGSQAKQTNGGIDPDFRKAAYDRMRQQADRRAREIPFVAYNAQWLSVGRKEEKVVAAAALAINDEIICCYYPDPLNGGLYLVSFNRDAYASVICTTESAAMTRCRSYVADQEYYRLIQEWVRQYDPEQASWLE
jgi:hypothetical protein